MSEAKKVVIVGAGTAGITIAAQLQLTDRNLDVVLIDPAEKHYYQPIWTLVGGGVFKKEVSERDMKDFIPDGCTWIQDFVTTFSPESNSLETKSSGSISYDYLIVAPGIHVNWDGIKGLKEAMSQPNPNVVSNYSYETVDKTFPAIEAFKQGGTAIFTHPNTPVKCGGGPMKIMYLMADYLRKNRKSEGSTIDFHKAGGAIFGVTKYKNALEKVVDRYGINTHWFTHLVEVRGDDNIAVFENLKTGELVDKSYDFLHVTPPMCAPKFLKDSSLGNEGGWIDVDKHTLQHKRHANIFSAGDCAALPTAKTGAAVRKQAPVVVENLLSLIDGKPLTSSYNGYSSCPLVTGYGKLILAEFDYDGNPVESFPFDQGKERYSMYALKAYGLPEMYWHGMLRGQM